VYDPSPVQEEGSFLIISLSLRLFASSFAFSAAVGPAEHQLVLAHSGDSGSLGWCLVMPCTNAVLQVPKYAVLRLEAPNTNDQVAF